VVRSRELKKIVNSKETKEESRNNDLVDKEDCKDQSHMEE
jgi:hypothetical protein